MSALTELPKGSLRRAGPPALIAAALLFGVLSVGYAWIVARHLRNDARETSRLLGHVFAGLNDPREGAAADALDRKSTRLNSSHGSSSYAVFCLKKKRLTCSRWLTTDRRR